LEQLVASTEAVSVPPTPYSRSEPSGNAELVAAPIVTSGIVDAILEVSRQRNSLLSRLRNALQSGNDTEALQLAGQLCGLPR